MNENSLSTYEAQRLAKCERTIRKERLGFLEVVSALIEIRDGNLYRPDHATFEDYLSAKWGLRGNRECQWETGPDRYMDANQVGELLNLAPGTIQIWRYKGKLPPAVKFGTSVKWRRGDIMAWAASQTEANSPGDGR
jgi:predicted DNA-binding transcriptional regulator AlpA